MPVFVGETYRENLVGLGLIALGGGIALVTALAVAARAEIAAARTSAASAAASVLGFALHGRFLWLAGLGLVAFGAACLAIASGVL
jgi:hypothetical protein